MVPLTERHGDLPHHPGQISLPGGRLDPGETAEAAALREAQEEIGVDPSNVRIIGALTPVFVIVSNFAIAPLLGVTDARPAFALAPGEVESLIEVPVDELTRDIRWAGRVRDDVRIEYPYFELGGRQVWGATAMILAELAALLRD